MPYLPNAEHAIVPPEKITRYLLCHDHPKGAPKAAFFESFGFSLDSWEVLRIALLEHAKTGCVVETEITPYGQIYEVQGQLPSPAGRNPFVLVVWMIRIGENIPRFVTVVPSKERTP